MQRGRRVVMCAHPSTNGGRRTSRVKSTPIPEEDIDEVSQGERDEQDGKVRSTAEEDKLLHASVHNHDKACTSITCDHTGECNCSNSSSKINDSTFATAR